MRREKFTRLLLAQGVLEGPKNRLGLSQRHPKCLGAQSTTLQLGHLVNPFGLTRIRFDRHLYLDFHRRLLLFAHPFLVALSIQL